MDMKRILIIGSPGSGKSTLAKQISKITQYPVLHLDRIFHIDNQNHITSEEMIERIRDFVRNNKTFIIDGNYGKTMEFRMGFSDTVIFYDIDTDTCLKNVIERTNKNIIRDDIAPGFDNSILDEEFIEYVRTFRENKRPQIMDLLNQFQGTIIRLENYEDTKRFLEQIHK